MPKNKFQDVIFTIIMVFVMVYTMICYNIALNVGGMNNQVFLNAFHELVIMGPIAFILDFFLIGPQGTLCPNVRYPGTVRFPGFFCTLRKELFVNLSG